MPLRLKAFLLHLSLSAVIALWALLLVFGLWYPSPLHVAVSVTHLFLLLLLVDVVLGPMLTLLVYKAGKKTLMFDLAVIAVLQLSALSYGLWTVAEGRPVWLVFNADRFDLVQAVDVDARRLEDALPQYRTPSWFGPRWVAAVQPTGIDRRNEILFEAVQGGSDIAQRPELYRSLDESETLMQSRAQALEMLAKFNGPDAVAEVIAEWPQASGWLPLMARVQPMVVLLGSDGTEVLGIVPLNPWVP